MQKHDPTCAFPRQLAIVIGNTAHHPWLATKRSTSPPWHRRQRSRRSKARKRLRDLVLGRHSDTPSPKYVRLLTRDLTILKEHHTRPHYVVASKVLSRMAWKQQSWQTRTSSWNTWPKKKQPKGNTPKEPTKEKGPKFPPYDSSSLSSSSQPSFSKEQMICKAMQDLVTSGKVEVSDELRELLEPTPGDTIKEQQQELNKRRKLVQRLERLKKAKQGKTIAWKGYQEEMALMLRQEQARYDKEQEELQQAIEETQIDIDKMGQEEDEEMPKQEGTEDLLSMTAANQDLRQKLMEEQAKTTQMQNSLRELQQQFQTYMAQQISDSPKPDASSPQQVKLPRTALPEEKQDKPDKAKAQETKERQARMRKVETEMLKQKELRARERSPRRESQDSNDFHALG